MEVSGGKPAGLLPRQAGSLSEETTVDLRHGNLLPLCKEERLASLSLV